MATLFVDQDATGTDDGSTWTNAWPTIDAAMNDVATRGAGPHTYLVRGGTYVLHITTQPIPTIDTAGASAATAITFRGDNGSGSPSQVILDCGTNSLASGIDSGLGSVNAYYAFEYFTVENATDDGFDIGASTDVVIFKHCIADTCGNWGFQADNFIQCESCRATGCSGGGFDADNETHLIDCVADVNTGHGIQTGERSVVFGCLAVSNSSDGIRMHSSNCVAINNTVDGDAKDTTVGIEFSNSAISIGVMVNNIAYDCATGISLGANIVEFLIMRNNDVNGNTTAYTNVLAGEGDISTAPGFANEGVANVPAGYILASTSGNINAGMPNPSGDHGYSIGAYQVPDDLNGGGGGGSGAKLINVGGGLIG